MQQLGCGAAPARLWLTHASAGRGKSQNRTELGLEASRKHLSCNCWELLHPLLHLQLFLRSDKVRLPRKSEELRFHSWPFEQQLFYLFCQAINVGSQPHPAFAQGTKLLLAT